MQKQDEDAKAFMQKTFVPEAAAGSVSAALVSADPKVPEGTALFQAGSCSSCTETAAWATAGQVP